MPYGALKLNFLLFYHCPVCVAETPMPYGALKPKIPFLIKSTAFVAETPMPYGALKLENFIANTDEFCCGGNANALRGTET